MEYLLSIAELVTRLVSREDLLKVQSGLSRLVIEDVESPAIDKGQLFQSLEDQRASGTLRESVTVAWPRYQASKQHPGLLERRHADGTTDIGMFKDGKFTVTRGPA
ncbi:MAG: hypothetical protein U5K56_20780 [Halioglobus sp.]|nr:hypothetical protein [Halioglobus sp.]